MRVLVADTSLGQAGGIAAPRGMSRGYQSGHGRLSLANGNDDDRDSVFLPPRASLGGIGADG